MHYRSVEVLDNHAGEADGLMTGPVSGGMRSRRDRKSISWTNICLVVLVVTQVITLVILFTKFSNSPVTFNNLTASSASEGDGPTYDPNKDPNLDENLENLEKDNYSHPFPDITLGQVVMSMPGHKLNIPHITPRENQEFRGTCWDFATIGILEWSYRQNGILKGWLKPAEYVAFSEQAYGAVVVDRCQKYPQLCLIPDDDIWLGTTEGGEIPLLQSLPNMGNVILPTTVCPYTSTEGQDTDCPGLAEALKNNPVNFTLKKMETLYEVEAIKKHLRKNGRVLGFSSAMTTVQYFKPCLGKYVQDNYKKCRRDENGQCPVMCPIDRFPPNTCCIAEKYPNYNREGEFYSRGATDFLDGGHAMQIVGYNDNFVTVDGEEGGFILKNNWLTNASHSIGYFMQVISRWDENILCPNSANPRNWYCCPTLEDCLSKKTKLYAQITQQPRELECISDKHCIVSPDITYFVKNYTVVGDNMHVICLFRYNEAHQRRGEKVHGVETCLMPLVLDKLADLLQPRKMMLNHPDHCGFYFWPYSMVKSVWSRFGNSYATDFEIEWHESSYLANARKYPGLDYSHLRASTRIQNYITFNGPIPYEHIKQPSQAQIDAARRVHDREYNPNPP
eukprot:gb/GEZN01003334.1/.p1 GENE.gb/GEZN01003334.1/~~gb/GEZN01003334.1/.p1  ORF type:complete len:619 (+),score=13.01 gb/GEZN01003334.1/:37-1893(+)